MSAWSRFCNWLDSPYEEPVTPDSSVYELPLLVRLLDPCIVVNSAALLLLRTLNELQTVIAGQCRTGSASRLFSVLATIF